MVPPLPGLETVEVLTSETLWGLETLPERLLVLGGGPIGCELGQAFARLGSRVALVEMGAQLLPREDAEIADEVARRLATEGVALHLGTRALPAVTFTDPEVARVGLNEREARQRGGPMR